MLSGAEGKLSRRGEKASENALGGREGWCTIEVLQRRRSTIRRTQKGEKVGVTRAN